MSNYRKFWEKYSVAVDTDNNKLMAALDGAWDRAYDVAAERHPEVEAEAVNGLVGGLNWDELRATIALELLAAS